MEDIMYSNIKITDFVKFRTIVVTIHSRFADTINRAEL